jgi:N utilization substance protein A
MRGSRVQAVVNELSGEKIDIIPWSPDPATFVVNALAPAEVSKVVLDEEGRRIEVIVPDAQLSLAIGRRGQNVRLASQLTGWDIDIVTESEEAERRTREFKALTEYFVNALNVEEVIAQLLVTEGFGSVDELLYVDQEELASIQGFDEGVADALRERAEQYLSEREAALREEAATLGLSEDLVNFDQVTLASIVELGRKGIKSLDDLADLAADELIELLPDAHLNEADAGSLIMAARAHWFDDDEAAAPAEADADAEPDAAADVVADAEADDAGEANPATDVVSDAEVAPTKDAP